MSAWCGEAESSVKKSVPDAGSPSARTRNEAISSRVTALSGQ